MLHLARISHQTPSRGAKLIRGLAVLAVVLSWGTERAFAQATVYVVRHAEKVVTGPDATDPPLTSSGAERALALAKTLRSVKFSAIYATEYRRTQLTVKPMAKRMKIKTTLVKADGTKKLAALLKQRPRGETVLVAAHSNTISSLLRALGVTESVSVREADYDNLFVVVPAEKGPPVFLRLHYGAFTEAAGKG